MAHFAHASDSAGHPSRRGQNHLSVYELQVHRATSPVMLLAINDPYLSGFRNPTRGPASSKFLNVCPNCRILFWVMRTSQRWSIDNHSFRMFSDLARRLSGVVSLSV